ncbi:MAG: hypothetical protein MZW92_51955 [Comamonadaceae bacterium]|nr:hypothetical protein [Comamonadaceae bacterium]
MDRAPDLRPVGQRRPSPSRAMPAVSTCSCRAARWVPTTSTTAPSFTWVSAGTWDNNTFAATMRLGGGWGEDNAIPAYDSFTLGGFQQLSGYDVNRFRGQGSALGRL